MFELMVEDGIFVLLILKRSRRVAWADSLGLLNIVRLSSMVEACVQSEIRP